MPPRKLQIEDWTMRRVNNFGRDGVRIAHHSPNNQSDKRDAAVGAAWHPFPTRDQEWLRFSNDWTDFTGPSVPIATSERRHHRNSQPTWATHEKYTLNHHIQLKKYLFIGDAVTWSDIVSRNRWGAHCCRSPTDKAEQAAFPCHHCTVPEPSSVFLHLSSKSW